MIFFNDFSFSQVSGSAANMLVYHLLGKHLLCWDLERLDQKLHDVLKG